MVWGCVGIIIGSILAASAFSMAQLTIARIILGAGIQFMTVAAPAYSMEIAPPQWRGRCTGFYNCGWFGGSIPAAFVTFGCQYIKSDWSWRIPFLGQCFACFIVLGSVYFIPESPRYLFANDRTEEAIEFLVKYHGNGNRNSRLVQLEIEEIQDSIRQELNDKKIPWWDFRGLYNTHEARWRSSQVLMMGVSASFPAMVLDTLTLQFSVSWALSPPPSSSATTFLTPASLPSAPGQQFPDRPHATPASACLWHFCLRRHVGHQWCL